MKTTKKKPNAKVKWVIDTAHDNLNFYVQTVNTEGEKKWAVVSEAEYDKADKTICGGTIK